MSTETLPIVNSKIKEIIAGFEPIMNNVALYRYHASGSTNLDVTVTLTNKELPMLEKNSYIEFILYGKHDAMDYCRFKFTKKNNFFFKRHETVEV